MLLRFCFVLLPVLSLPDAVLCQDSVKFYEVIDGDSVRLFFNSDYYLVGKNCAEYTRYIRIDDKANFHGSFEDVSQNNVLFSKGRYINGKKEGYFELFYPNGKPRCKGNYLDGEPVGQWEFFYENGIPERTLQITGADTLLIKFFDSKGRVKVENGNGQFDGEVAEVRKTRNGLMKVKGKVVNGKADGTWTAYVPDGATYGREEFKQGVFVRGTFPKIAGATNQYYYDQPFLNTFFLGNYLSKLESFKVENCPEPTSAPAVLDYSFDYASFKTDLRSKIERVINAEIQNGNTKYYPMGINTLSIEFSLDKEGTPEYFKLTSYWGQPFLFEISEAIKRRAKFPPGYRKMYFHMKLNLPAGNAYNYEFQFSRQANYN